MTRLEVVDELISSANAAMESVAGVRDATGNEVLSAYFSLASSAISVAVDLGVDRSLLRDIVEQLMLKLADPTPTRVM